METKKQILIVSGSIRPGSMNQVIVRKLLELIEADNRVGASVADLKELSLPLFDASTPPSSPDFVTEHQSVIQWGEMVEEADAILLAMPEYNRAMSAVQKNAIDWLFHQWKDKVIGIVSYGFHQGRRAVANFESINGNIGAKLIEPVAMLQYGQEIGIDASISNPDRFRAIVQPTVEAVIQATSR